MSLQTHPQKQNMLRNATKKTKIRHKVPPPKTVCNDMIINSVLTCTVARSVQTGWWGKRAEKMTWRFLMNNRHDCKGERPRQPVCCRTNAPAPPATSIPVDLRGPKNLTLECTHTCTHTPGITCGARLSGMSDFKGCFIFGSSVGFVALLCWQTRKQVANIKHYSGAVTHPNKHTHTCVRARARSHTFLAITLRDNAPLEERCWLSKGLPAAHLTARPKSERRGVRASLAHETRWQGAAITQESILWSANLAGALRAVCSTISMIPGGNQKHFGNHPPFSLSVV